MTEVDEAMRKDIGRLLGDAMARAKDKAVEAEFARLDGEITAFRNRMATLIDAAKDFLAQ